MLAVEGLVAVVGAVDDYLSNFKESFQYARLFAAAPDLLKALDDLQSQAFYMNSLQHAGLDLKPMDWSRLDDLTNAARVAIKKAGVTK